MTTSVEGKTLRHIGRPRANVALELVLNAYKRHHSINRVAKELNISSGLAYHRLVEVGVAPLGMSRSERGKFGAEMKRGKQ